MKAIHRDLLLALVSGAIAGTVILGIVGRAVTVTIAVATDNPLNLSLKGAMEVVIIGTLIGAIGGILLFVLRRNLSNVLYLRGIVVGALLFTCSVLVLLTWGTFRFSYSGLQLLTLISVLIVYMAYGIIADFIQRLFIETVDE